MGRELLLMRHAKSAWDTGAPTDFDRPLNNRGRKASRRMGAWLREHGCEPDLVVASTALRVRQTLEGLLPELGSEPKLVWEESIYEASPGALFGVLAGAPPEATRVLLVGHNPGLAILVEHFGGVDESFPTAALAHFGLPDDWSDLADRSGELHALIRPRELEE